MFKAFLGLNSWGSPGAEFRSLLFAMPGAQLGALGMLRGGKLRLDFALPSLFGLPGTEIKALG